MTETADSNSEFLKRISELVQSGKTNAETDIPPGSKGTPGVVETTQEALAAGISAEQILEQGLLGGMQILGKKFAANEVFIPEVLIAARAMQAGFAELKDSFSEKEVPSRGVFVIGTVKGDLHDIGKNLLAIILEGSGWEIKDLGTDCPPEKFIEAIDRYPGCVIGLSALLTTTMSAMRDTVQAIKNKNPETVVLVGGAPVTADFASQIGADGYAADPSAAVGLLVELVPDKNL